MAAELAFTQWGGPQSWSKAREVHAALNTVLDSTMWCAAEQR